tara:strand:+ start:3252 stop:4538 length:1287 start_codon:yes stop_codon:yes gene_type:complete
MKLSKFKSLILIILIGILAACQSKAPNLYSQLSELPEVTIEKIEGDTTFTEYYEMWFTQPIDHENPKLGSFKQRVLLGHHDLSKPMVVEIQGYNIWTEKAGELSKLIDANQLTIEHRYFKQSRPDSLLWDKLTIKQAAADQHAVIQALKKIYKNKWISTGISKGGQTTIYHRYFYPNDVDISVPYVAPMNLSREDKRIHEHLTTVGTEESRKKVNDFQVACFEKKADLIPLLENLAIEKNWEFSMGIEGALDMNILEYSFAFWQWGNTNLTDIPNSNANAEELFKHLTKTSPFTFFEAKDIITQQPFFYQALTEIGMYSYEVAPFSKYISYDKDLTFDFTLPWGVNGNFNSTSMQAVNKWLQTDAEKMLFIYGEYDTWSATQVDLKDNSKCKKFINPEGAHRTRIHSFPPKMQEEIIKTLETWLAINN